MDCENIKVPEEYKDICPISDDEFHKEMSQLVTEPGFEHAIKYVMPDVNYKEFIGELLKINNKNDFQIKVMLPFLEMLAFKTSDGITADGKKKMLPKVPYTFITNHRDIVLDASFLNLILLRNKLQSTEVAIGNNLLIFDWIEVLVKLNKSFIVRRDLSMRQALEAAKQLSGYIHFTLKKKKQSVWIAQREGRAKDSNDLTQESLIKMLGLAGDRDILQNLLEINLMPVAISYEYDPNDYLKAKEFLLKRDNPNFKKSQRDDLFSMETGLLQQKGHIHFEFTECLNDKLKELEGIEDRAEVAKNVCTLIDKAIHSHYRIYPGNYIAYDKINNGNQFADKYTANDIKKFEKYISAQLDKVDIPDLSYESKTYLYEMMLKMYANPLTNKLLATL